VIAVVLALIFGGSAAVGVRQYITRNSAPQVEKVSVVVAAAGMPRGMLVSPALVKTVDYPKQLVPEGALLKAEDAHGRSTFTTLAKDEPVLDTKLSPKGYRGLASLIPAGMRAFTINTVNVAAGVAGFILPGNKVDVLLTVANTGSTDLTGGGSTTTLLQNVEILAVDQKVEAPAENKVDTKEMRSVTLLVTPDQAAKLDLGQNKGTLHLTLRNPEDTFAANVRPVTVKDIQFLQESPGRPWDERAKDLLKAWGEALAKARLAAAPPRQQPPAQAAAPAKRSIRTLRGSNEGMVIVTPLGPSG
jgi:pilus assembly protein CpaB